MRCRAVADRAAGLAEGLAVERALARGVLAGRERAEVLHLVGARALQLQEGLVHHGALPRAQQRPEIVINPMKIAEATYSPSTMMAPA